MARVGQFGRRPRVVPSLSSTIVAMLREYAAMKDQNIMTAWERGGFVDGKKVTDDMMLGHWKDRRDAVGKDDPLWDYYNNQILNLEFVVEETKMALKYAEKKVGEGAMAAFYKKWAKKSPTDSQVHRNLMIKAAQFLDAARGRASGGRAAASQTAYNNEMAANRAKYHDTYDQASDILRYALVREGVFTKEDETWTDMIINGQQGLTGDANTPASPGSDPSRFLAIFDLIYTDPRFAEEAKALNAVLKGKPLTYELFQSLMRDKHIGLKTGAKIAAKYKDKATVNDYNKQSQELTQARLYIGDMDVLDAYSILHDELTEFMSSKRPPWELPEFLDYHAGQLEMLRDSAGDPYIEGAINNEIIAAREGRSVGPSPYDDSTPYRGASGKTNDDSSSTAEARKMADEMQAIVDGGGVWTKDKNGNWQAYPAAVFGQGLLDLSKGVLLPHVTDGGKVQMVFAPTKVVSVEGVNIQGNEQGSTGLVPYTGKGEKPQSGETSILGVGYDDPFVGTFNIGVVDKNGDLQWFGSSPTVAGVQLRNGPDEAVLTMPVGGPGWKPTDAIDQAALDPTLPRSDREYDPSIAQYFASPMGTRALAQTSIEKIEEAYKVLDPFMPPGQKRYAVLDPFTGQPTGETTSFDKDGWGEALALAKTLAPYQNPDNEALRARAARRVGAMVWSGDQLSMDRAREQAYKLRAMERYDRIGTGEERRMQIERDGRANERVIPGYWDAAAAGGTARGLKAGDPDRELKGSFIRTDINTPGDYRRAVIEQVRLAAASEAILLKNRQARGPSAPDAWAPGRGGVPSTRPTDWDSVISGMTSETYAFIPAFADPMQATGIKGKTQATPTIKLPGLAADAGVRLPSSLMPGNVSTNAFAGSAVNPGRTAPAPPKPMYEPPPVYKPPTISAYKPPKPAPPKYKPVHL